MGIYWCAIDAGRKEKFNPPKNFSITSPGIFHPKSPFPAMLVMMNSYGYNFELINDSDWEGPYYDGEYKDITEQVYEKLIDVWLMGRDFYEEEEINQKAKKNFEEIVEKSEVIWGGE